MIVPTSRVITRAVCLIGCMVLFAGPLGCASYSVPGGPADYKAMGLTRDQLTDVAISETLSKRPLASFPCGIAAVRIQAPGYHSETAQSYGSGQYCVITTRDIEKSEQWDRLAKMPGVAGVATVNRLLLPQQLNSDMELRKAAANLHADMLLIYTVDTTFRTDDVAAPLTIITLGLSPNQVVNVISTASAVLLDTRNGYLYGYAEATEKTKQLSSGWTTTQAVDAARQRAEEKSFDKLTGEIEKSWSGVVKTYAAGAQRS